MPRVFLSMARNALEGRILLRWTCSSGEDRRNSKIWFWFWPSWLFHQDARPRLSKTRISWWSESTMGWKYSFAKGTSLGLCSENKKGASIHPGTLISPYTYCGYLLLPEQKTHLVLKKFIAKDIAATLHTTACDRFWKAVRGPHTHSFRKPLLRPHSPK